MFGLGFPVNLSRFARFRRSAQSVGAGRWRVCVALSVGLTLILFWLSKPAGLFAFQETPATLETDAEYSFGQQMRFTLKATSASPIEKATLLIQTPEYSNTMTAEFDVSPDRQITITHVVDLTQLRLAPFTTVTYWWSVVNQNGTSIESSKETIDYLDDQFNWQRIDHDGIQVNWSGDDAAVGPATERAMLATISRIEEFIPIEQPEPLRVYVYPSAADLRAGLRLTGRDWVGAHARPELGVILVVANDPSSAEADLAASIAHELAHLYLYTATGDGYESAPLWLDEGLASLVEGETSHPDYAAARLEEALEDGETIPLSDICHSVPSDEDLALLAYAQSEAFVGYLQNEYGNQGLQHLIAEVAGGAGCQSAPLRALGLSLAELNEDWLQQEMPQSMLRRAWLNGRGWIVLILAGFFLAGLLAWVPRAKRQ